jgi:hypothetical protein
MTGIVLGFNYIHKIPSRCMPSDLRNKIALYMYLLIPEYYMLMFALYKCKCHILQLK